MAQPSYIDQLLLRFTNECVRWVIRFLTLLMIVVIGYSAFDVFIIVLSKIMSVPTLLITVEDLTDLFGAFLSVLIAIEIYQNIVIYLREDAIHVKVVIATVVIAVSRKVIVLDFTKVEPLNLFALGFLVIAVSVAYWLVRYDNIKIVSRENK